MAQPTDAEVFEVPRERSALLERIRASLALAKSMRDGTRSEGARMADRTALRVWQAARLERSYSDLLAAPRHQAAARFFLSDLYGAKDFTERDEEIARIVPTLASVLPIGAVQSLALAVEVDALTEELDAQLLARLRASDRSDRLTIDTARYAAAYRACANRPARERQIALIYTIAHLLDQVAHKALVTAAMELMRGPAHLAGLAELYDFLERGLSAFRRMQGAEEFLDTIRTRETAIMDRLFAADPDPFRTSPAATGS